MVGLAKRLAERIPAWIELAKALVEYLTNHEHEFDLTITTEVGGRPISLHITGKTVRKTVEEGA
ncbi:MAG TPA: hypothetical protein ENF34_04385 [Candidatus Bathyarchaeota archaeon]|nr:MAG: hypothetical protein DRO60_01815 [Candidatus Bathyarchaeota archaeon]HDJ26532.1 hypothetical protein [Candidatus Bathyarchaeota archaeon]